MEKTRASYGLPASGPVQPQLPWVLCEVGAVSPAKLGHAGADAGVHRNTHGCTGTRRNHRSDEAEKGAINGEVLEVPDLWAADTQTIRDAAAGRNRAGVRREGGPQAADGQGEEAGFSCAEKCCAAPTHSSAKNDAESLA